MSLCYQVLKVHCKKRTGDENFISCMRNALAKHYTNEKTVGKLNKNLKNNL